MVVTADIAASPLHEGGTAAGWFTVLHALLAADYDTTSSRLIWKTGAS